jgi:predicted DNA-binding transcriptional regulator AlpA
MPYATSSAWMSRAELLELPAVVDLPTACRALGIGRTLGYTLARRGEFPCRVMRLGRLYRVATVSLLDSVGGSVAHVPGGGREGDAGHGGRREVEHSLTASAVSGASDDFEGAA